MIGEWFVTPTEFPHPGFRVVRFLIDKYQDDDCYFESSGAAQARADELNKESQ